MWFKQMTAIAAGVLLSSNVVHALDSMDDDDMRQIQGQALFNTNYIAPGAGNPNANIGFYRLGLEAELQLNANIRRLALGCDGANATGVCDIDISNVRLTGVSAGAGVDAGPPTSAVLTNPFLEFAIKNPNSASTREISGLRFGSLGALGKLSIGENPNPASLADDTGITRLSGDLTANVINAVLTNVNVCVGFTAFGACVGIPLSGSATVASYSQQLILDRATTVADLGPMVAVASGSLLGLTLTNTHLNNTPLRTIHEIAIQNTDGTPTRDFYLSLQKEAINWQKTSTNSFTGSVAAQPGWWLSLPQVVLEDVTSNDRIDVGAFAALGGAAFGTRVDIDPVDLGQRPVDNCFGALTFC